MFYVEGTQEQVNELYAALFAAQAEFPPVKRTKQGHPGKYAPLDKILDVIRPILIKNKLAVCHPITQADGKLMVGTTLIHAHGGRMSSDGLVIPESIPAQQQGAFITYGIRYGYCAMLGVSSQDDDDGASLNSPRVGGAGRSSLARKAPPIAVPGGDSGANPDPSLPTKIERQKYANALRFYSSGGVNLKDLEAYCLGQSGASEARFITKTQWDGIMQRLDDAHNFGGIDAIKHLLGVS